MHYKKKYHLKARHRPVYREYDPTITGSSALCKRLKMSVSLQSSFAHAVSLAGIHSRAHFATSSAVCPSDLRGKLPWRVCVRAVCTPTSEFIHQPHSGMRLTCTMRCFRRPQEEILRNAPSSWPCLRPRHRQRYASVLAVVLKCFNCWEILLPFWNDWDMFFLPRLSSLLLSVLIHREPLFFVCVNDALH